jgi:membrane peptidoglycan carboxypeptidase
MMQPKKKVAFQPPQKNNIRAPHFVMFVREYLIDKYGEDVVKNGGLSVITTLDYSLQQKGEEIVKRYALENEKNK